MISPWITVFFFCGSLSRYNTHFVANSSPHLYGMITPRLVFISWHASSNRAQLKTSQLLRASASHSLRSCWPSWGPSSAPSNGSTSTAPGSMSELSELSELLHFGAIPMNCGYFCRLSADLLDDAERPVCRINPMWTHQLMLKPRCRWNIRIYQISIRILMVDNLNQLNKTMFHDELQAAKSTFLLVGSPPRPSIPTIHRSTRKITNVTWDTGILLLHVDTETLTGLKPGQIFYRMETWFLITIWWTNIAMENGHL